MEKIQKIRDNFKVHDVNPIEILQTLITKPKSTFSLKAPSVARVKQIISKFKASNASGYDGLSIKVFKKLNDKISPAITHLITCMYRTSIYPDVLKVSKISPNLKTDKNPLNMDSYRPINNLITLDKIIEEDIKTQMTDYFDHNRLLLDQHHGSRTGHGTETATAHIDQTITENYDSNYITTILQTDLSAAFDTVDAQTLIDKLQYYGLDDNSLRLLNSFLTDRQQFVSIDSFDSNLIKCPPCSVIQGSKLSSLLYSIYTNEIPRLNRLMDTKHYFDMTKTKMTNNYTNTRHETINYVDDSTNIISDKDHTKIQDYINDFYKLLEVYYDVNKLKINADKSKIVVICKPLLRHVTDNIILKASGYQIVQSDFIKILGIYYTKTFDNTKNVNTIISKVTYRFNILQKILNIAPVKTRRILCTSLLISIIRYGSGHLTNITDAQMTKINSLMLRISRTILGIKSFKMSTTNIFAELNWLSFPQMIRYEATKIIYNINILSQPKSILKYFNFDNKLCDTRRMVRTPALTYKPNMAKTAKTQLFRGVFFYSKLPLAIRVAKKLTFKNQLKSHIMRETNVYSMERPIT